MSSYKPVYMIAVLVVYGVYTRGFSLDRPLGLRPRALSELSHSCIVHKPLAAIHTLTVDMQISQTIHYSMVAPVRFYYSITTHTPAVLPALIVYGLYTTSNPFEVIIQI